MVWIRNPTAAFVGFKPISFPVFLFFFLERFKIKEEQ